MDDRLPRAPVGLQGAGQSFWRAMNTQHTFSVAELEILSQACRTKDVIVQLQRLIEGEGLMVEGQRGSRVHPALSELRQQRAALKGLLAALNLPPDENSPGQTPRQRRAQKAAETRWKVSRNGR